MYSLKRCDKCGGYKVEIKEEPQPKEPITFKQEAPEPCKCEVSHET